MDAAPEGFVTVPGTERGSGATRVFCVARGGATFLCKRLGPRALTEGWMRERLTAEARVLETLAGRAGPALVAHGSDGSGPWLVMERLPWSELASHLGAAVAPSWVADVTLRAYRALARVHEAAFVHGDVSPGNVLAADDGAHVALIDFGLAQGPGLPAMPPGLFRGSLTYAAPEVARGEPFDASADVFAMAASLLHVACGAPPRVPTAVAAMLQSAGEEPIEAWAHRAAQGLPREIASLLERCCAFDPSRRPTAPLAGVA